jgi:HK97 family phage major capsid protein
MVDLSFSSEDAEVDRWFGLERLDHAPKSIRLDRLNDGAPLLLNHDPSQQIGVVERAWIDNKDKKGRAEVRFSRSALASEILIDVLDNIRRNVSTGYRVHDFKLESSDDSGEHYRVTDWEPLELSIVSVPADPGVGIGRSMEGNPTMEPKEVLDSKTPAASVAIVSADQIEAQRIETLEMLGTKLGDNELAKRGIAEGWTGEDFRREWLKKQNEKQIQNPVPQKPESELDLTQQEVRQYSLTRVIRALAGLGTREEAKFEFECSDAIAKKRGVPSRGAYIPYDKLLYRPPVSREDTEVLHRMAAYYGMRLTNVGTGASPGPAFKLVGTEHLYQSFIEMLYNNMVCMSLGVQVLGGLNQNVSIPKQTGSVTGAWVAEGVAAAASDIAVGNITLTPKTFSAQTEFTRLALLQSLPQVDQLILSDMAKVNALGIDKAILAGPGTGGSPTGILAAAGVNVANQAGVNFTFADAVNMETLVLEANAGFPGAAYVGRPGVMGALKTKVKLAAGSDIPMIGADGTLNGYPFAATTQMPTGNIIFGAFSQVLLGEWGTVEIRVNPYGTNANAGNVEVYSFQTVDVALRYGQAFSKCTNFAP